MVSARNHISQSCTGLLCRVSVKITFKDVLRMCWNAIEVMLKCHWRDVGLWSDVEMPLKGCWSAGILNWCWTAALLECCKLTSIDGSGVLLVCQEVLGMRLPVSTMRLLRTTTWEVWGVAAILARLCLRGCSLYDSQYCGACVHVIYSGLSKSFLKLL